MNLSSDGRVANGGFATNALAYSLGDMRATSNHFLEALRWHYFLAVKQRWPEAWENVAPGNILNRTNGFRALMAVLGRAYNTLAKRGDYVSAADFRTLFDKVDCGADYFTVDNFKPGTSGEAALRRFLEEHMFGGEAGKLFARIVG